MNSHAENRDTSPAPAMTSGVRQRLAGVLSKVSFGALLFLLIIAALAYGGSDPLWKVLLTCAIFAVGCLAAGEMLVSDNIEVPASRLLLPILVLVLFSFLQTVPVFPGTGTAFGIHLPFWNAISADPYETRIFALELLALVLLAALFSRYARSEGRLRLLIHTVIGIAAVSAVFGLLRQTMQHSPGFLLPLLQPERGYGQFINKNHFAYLMEMGFGLALGLVAAGRGGRNRALVYLIMLLPIWPALVLSNSRGGILAMLAQLVVTVLLLPAAIRDHGAAPGKLSIVMRSTTARLVLVAGLMLLVGAGVLWVGGDRLASNIEATRGEFAEATELHEGASRLSIWRATLLMIRANPIAGVGMGGYWTAVPAYHEASGIMTPQQAHNDYLELLASGGLLGVALFVWFVVVMLKGARANLRTSERFRRAQCFAALIALTGVAIHSLVDFGLHRMLNAMLFVALIIIATQKVGGHARLQRKND